MRGVVKKYSPSYYLIINDFEGRDDVKYYRLITNLKEFPILIVKRERPRLYYLPHFVGDALGDGAVIKIKSVTEATKEDYYRFLSVGAIRSMGISELPVAMVVRAKVTAEKPRYINLRIPFPDVRKNILPKVTHLIREDKTALHFSCTVKGAPAILHIYPRSMNTMLSVWDAPPELAEEVKKTGLVYIKPARPDDVVWKILFRKLEHRSKRLCKAFKERKRPISLSPPLTLLTSTANVLLFMGIITKEEHYLLLDLLMKLNAREVKRVMEKHLGKRASKKAREILVLSMLWALKWRSGEYYSYKIFMNEMAEKGLNITQKSRKKLFAGCLRILKELGLYPEAPPYEEALENLCKHAEKSLSECEKRDVLRLAKRVEDVIAREFGMNVSPHIRRVLSVMVAMKIILGYVPFQVKVVNSLKFRTVCEKVLRSLVI